MKTFKLFSTFFGIKLNILKCEIADIVVLNALI